MGNSMHYEKLSGRLQSVYVCKGIAILMIILVRAAQRFDLPQWARIIPRFCQMGCQWFFVLSSFLLCMSYERKKQSIFCFLSARVRSIWLPYVVAIALTVFLSKISVAITGKNHVGSSTDVVDILINVLLLNGLFPTTANNHVLRGGWFVGTIVLLYAFFPFLFRVCRLMKRKNKYWMITFPLTTCVFSVGFGAMIGMWIYPKWLSNNSFGYFSLVNQLPAWVFGFILYDAYTYEWQIKIKYPGLKGFLLLSGALLLFTMGWRYSFVFLPFLCGIAFSYLTVTFLRRENEGLNNCCMNTLSLFGKLSFEIYLVHTFVVYDGVKLFYTVLKMLGIEVPGLLLFCIMFPVLTAFCLLLAYWFSLAIIGIRSRMKWL